MDGKTTTFTEARKSFAATWDDVVTTQKPVTVTRVGSPDIVWLPRELYQEIMVKLTSHEDQVQENRERQRQEKIDRVKAMSGVDSDVFEPGFLASLRAEWSV